MPLFIPFAPDSVNAYLRSLAARAADLGVGLRLEPRPTLDYQGSEAIQVSGYFVASPAPVLAVAMGKPMEEWLAILVHEGCHMEQWAEQAPCWQENLMPDGREAVDWLDAWCGGQHELAPEVLRDVVTRAKAVELDCERRSLEVMKQWQLPLCPKEYAQRANAYVHFYDRVAQIRRWNAPGQAPYQCPDIWRCAPEVLVERAPPELERALALAYPEP